MAKNCKIGKSCSSACVSKAYKCRVTLEGQAKRVLRELKAERKAEILARADERTETLKDWGSDTIASVYRQARREALDPNNDPEIRAEMMARAVGARRVLAKIEADRAEEKALEKKQLQKMVDESPKYSKTPGSHKPLKAKSLEEESELLEAQIKKWEKDAKEEGLYNEANFEANFNRWVGQMRTDLRLYQYAEESINSKRKIIESLDSSKEGDRDRITILQREIAQLSKMPPPPLEAIYARQGFNAKPELVDRVRDLEKRPGMMKGEDGENLIIFRGVSNVEYADQFRGGEVHYAGRGVYGNGSYSAYATAKSKATTRDDPYYGKNPHRRAIDEALGYGDRTQPRSLIAYGLREDARVAVTKNGDDRRALVERAKRETGYDFGDPGEAAAALGYDAWSHDNSSEVQYMILLNRGAAVAATEGGFKPDSWTGG